MHDSQFALDASLTDMVSGVTGRVIGITVFLYAQPSYLLAYKDYEGAPKETWFEEERLGYTTTLTPVKKSRSKAKGV